MIAPTTREHRELVAGPKPCPTLTRVALALLIVGGLFSIAAVISDDSRSRFAYAYLWAFSFVWTVALGALFFVGLHHLVHAVWSVVLRRIAEMFASSMWLVAILFLPLIVFCIWHDHFLLYSWLDQDPSSHAELLREKRTYLNLPFFTLRAAAFFAVWIGFTAHYVGNSLKQDDVEGDIGRTMRMRKTSAVFVMIFSFTMTFAGIDWLMSLEPLWFSTIFGVYVFAGMVVTALAIITIATITMRSSGRLGSEIIGDAHLYNLGALMFAFVTFWAYIAFSQYMLIWYGNIPEESFYMADRLQGGWLTVSVALALLRFIIPFLALLSRPSKTNPRRLLWVAALLLAGQLLDLYWLIMPQIHHDGPMLGWQELGPPLLLIGALILYVSHFLKRHTPLAVGDPLLDESRQLCI